MFSGSGFGEGLGGIPGNLKGAGPDGGPPDGGPAIFWPGGGNLSVDEVGVVEGLELLTFSLDLVV